MTNNKVISNKVVDPLTGNYILALFKSLFIQEIPLNSTTEKLRECLGKDSIIQYYSVASRFVIFCKFCFLCVVCRVRITFSYIR